MADAYATLSNGRILLRQPTLVSTGVPEAGDIVALDANGKLDASLFATGTAEMLDFAMIEAFETLTAGDLVNVFDDAGTPKVRKAIANAVDKEADGFVLTNTGIGVLAKVFFEGTLTRSSAFSASFPERRYLSAVSAGNTVTTPPSASGQIVQYIGVNINNSNMIFEPSPGIIIE